MWRLVNVGYVHIHLIPPYAGDVDDPRGGIRWIIPAKGKTPYPRAEIR